MKHSHFDTIIFIDELVNDLNAKSYNKIYIILDKLCKKIDVVKKVYTSYEFDLSKATTTKELSKDEYRKLLGVLLFFAEEKHDFKFLNSSLKLLDKLNIDKSEKDKFQKTINNILKETR